MKIPLVDLKAQHDSIRMHLDCAIKEVIDNSAFIGGKYVSRFEYELRTYLGTKHAVGVSSGSSALVLALKAYGVGRGDEVITVPNTFIATAEAIVHCGAKPVFVDVDEKTMLMDTMLLERKINNHTKALIPVHLYGQACDMDSISDIANHYNLKVVEDAAQAIGTRYKGQPLPVHETATLSFFPAKNLGCMGDGGAILTRNDEIASRVLKLRDHGRIDKYNSDEIGFGERLDALQAAILNVKLCYLHEWTHKRQYIAKYYNDAFAQEPRIRTPFATPENPSVHYVYVMRVKERDELQAHLNSQGIATGIYYPIPLHLQGAFSHLNHRKGDFPVTEQASEEILSIPLYPEMTHRQMDYVVGNVLDFYKRR